MVFVVMIPMIIGPFIGRAVSRIDGTTALNAYGEESILPNQYIFLFAAIMMLFVAIPLYLLIKKEKENE